MTPTGTKTEKLPADVARDTRLTLVLLGVTALALVLGPPVTWIVLVTGPGTMTFAIIALIRSQGVPNMGGLRVWLWVAIAVGIVSLLSAFGMLLLRGPIENRQACLETAITESAKRECEVQFEQDTEDLMTRYGVPTRN